MTTAQKLNELKIRLNLADSSEDQLLLAHLHSAESLIIDWVYSGEAPEGLAGLPSRYDAVQIEAVVTGYNANGIDKNFRYPGMVEYIHNNVVPMAKVM